MDIKNVVKKYRPCLVSFLQTKRTADDARVFAADCVSDGDGDGHDWLLLPTLFSIMSNDPGHKATYAAEMASVARKLTIGILRYPHNDFDLQAVLNTFMEKIKMFKAASLGQSINQECDQLDLNFWTKMWQDMEEGYYDDFMKHVLVLRIEMLQQCTNITSSSSSYSTQTVLQFFDMEYIKKNMYLHTYHFMSVFEFVRAFILEKIDNVLKPSFNAMCDNFVSETTTAATAITSNETNVRVLRFLVKHMIDYLYLEVEHY